MRDEDWEKTGQGGPFKRGQTAYMVNDIFYKQVSIEGEHYYQSATGKPILTGYDVRTKGGEIIRDVYDLNLFKKPPSGRIFINV